MKLCSARSAPLIVILALLSACGQRPEPAPLNPADPPKIRPMPRPQTTNAAATPDSLDQTSLAEKQQALAASPVASGAEIGVTIATLGDVTQQGFWLRTPLVGQDRPGQIRWVETGKTLKVTLIAKPAAPGSGSQISLAALRALGASLTDLVELRVYAD